MEPTKNKLGPGKRITIGAISGIAAALVSVALLKLMGVGLNPAVVGGVVGGVVGSVVATLPGSS